MAMFGGFQKFIPRRHRGPRADCNEDVPRDAHGVVYDIMKKPSIDITSSAQGHVPGHRPKPLQRRLSSFSLRRRRGSIAMAASSSSVSSALLSSTPGSDSTSEDDDVESNTEATNPVDPPVVPVKTLSPPPPPPLPVFGYSTFFDSFVVPVGSLPPPPPPPLPVFGHSTFFAPIHRRSSTGPLTSHPTASMGTLKRRFSAPSLRKLNSASAVDGSSVTTKTTHNISIRSRNSTELTQELSTLSNRLPSPTPIHIQSITIDLGNGQSYANFETAVAAIRDGTQNSAYVTIIATGDGSACWIQHHVVGGRRSVDLSGPSGLTRSRTTDDVLDPLRPRSETLLDRLNVIPGALRPATPPPPQMEEQRWCVICMNELHVNDQFVVPTSSCDHDSHTCKNCMEEWIRTRVGEGIFRHITCPEGGCGIELGYDDVRRAVDTEKNMALWRRYDTLYLRQYLAALPNFIWCLSSDCASGQIHDPENGPIMTCISCSYKTCATHGIPWHEGSTCAQYDLWHFGRVRNEERFYRAVVKVLGMKNCPGCGVTIQKADGCDHMRCSMCNFEFCYRCRADYDGPRGIWSRGKGAHRLACRHYWARMPWRWFRD